MPGDNLSIEDLQVVLGQMDKRRSKEPLRGRIIETVVAGLQMMSEGRQASGSLGCQSIDEYGELLKRATWRFQTDAWFHAVSQSMFQEIMKDIHIGEDNEAA